MKFQDYYRVSEDKELLDKVFSGRTINSETVMNNNEVISKLAKSIQDFTHFDEGIKLFTIEIGKTKHNILISKINNNIDTYKYYPKYIIFIGEEAANIDLPFSIVEHQSSQSILLSQMLADNRDQVQQNILVDVVSYGTVDTLDGCEVSLPKISEGIKLFKYVKPTTYSSELQSPHTCNDSMLFNIIKSITDTTTTHMHNNHTTIDVFKSRLKTPELHMPIKQSGHFVPLKLKEFASYGHELSPYNNTTAYPMRWSIYKLNNVRRLNNTRLVDIEEIRIYQGNNFYTVFKPVTYSIMVNASTNSATGGLNNIDNLGYSKINGIINQYDNRNMDTRIFDIPFNFIDEGRIVIEASYNYKKCVHVYSNDPMIDSNYIDNLKQLVNNMITANLDENIMLDGIRAIDPNKYPMFTGSRGLIGTKANILKEIKSCTDEFIYLYKRDRITDDCIKLTDKLEYNPKIGKLKIDDFTLETTDPVISSELINNIKQYVKRFFNKELTEQNIIDEVLNVYFHSLYRSIDRKKCLSIPTSFVNDIEVVNDPDTEVVSVLDIPADNYDIKLQEWIAEHKLINITLNENVNITFKCGAGGNSFCYINNIRFNINELVPVFKEIICYRNQETADKFIQMVGKIGLATFIGISSGYISDEKIYKFKKTNGRSNYELLIGDAVIRLKGKDVITYLYSITNQSGIFTKHIERKIFDCIIDYEDYVKFKFLINASYTEYIKKSHEYLVEKVNDADANIVTYFDTNRGEKKSAVYLTGISGNKYAIVYDANESFIFMNPSLHDTSTDEDVILTNGNYICMIDQSSVKSKIGYDTVISKLFALKNDSIVATNIYNLKDELE